MKQKHEIKAELVDKIMKYSIALEVLEEIPYIYKKGQTRILEYLRSEIKSMSERGSKL